MRKPVDFFHGVSYDTFESAAGSCPDAPVSPLNFRGGFSAEDLVDCVGRFSGNIGPLLVFRSGTASGWLRVSVGYARGQRLGLFSFRLGVVSRGVSPDDRR